MFFLQSVIITGNEEDSDLDYEKFAENIDDFEYVQPPSSSDTSQPLVHQPKDYESWTVLVIVPVASVFPVLVVVSVLLLRQRRKKSAELTSKLCVSHHSISISSATDSEVRERFQSQ